MASLSGAPDIVNKSLTAMLCQVFYSIYRCYCARVTGTGAMGKRTPKPPRGQIDWDALELPKHKRFQLMLEEKIRSGVWGPGERIPTEKDFMAEYELSYATVSRAVRELAKAGLVERTRKRGTFVTDNPRNFVLPSLPAHAANTLALFHGWQDQKGFHPYFTALVDGLITAAGKRGMGMKFISVPGGSLGVDAEFRERHGVAGMLVTRARKAELEAALRNHIPVVFLSTDWRDLEPDRVIVDMRAGYERVFRRLRKGGHDRVAVVDVRRRIDLAELAADVFECLPDDVPVDEIYTRDFTDKGATSALRRLDRLRPRPTAAYVGDDFLLMHLLRLLRERGVAVPGDMAVIGRGTPFSDAMLGGGITMVETDPADIAEAGVALLMEQIEQGRGPGRSVTVTPRLVARKSG